MKNQLLNSFSNLWSYKTTQKHPQILKEIFSVLAYYSDEFLKDRTCDYLRKLAKTHSILKEHFSKNTPKDLQRNFHMKFLAVKFKDPHYKRKVLGIVFSFHFLSEYEKFGYKHLSKILKRMIPGAHILEDSFFLCSFHKKDLLFCYLEIEKIRGKSLNFQECYRLKKELPQEIQEGIELSAPKLFTPPNEEETFRNILRLNKEMISPNDRAHVIISFQDQDAKTVKFSVILVRILKVDEPLIQKLFSEFPIKMQIQIHRKERLKNKYIKETAVLSLELKTSLFFRKDYSVDLLKARQYICMMLNLTIGEFRDYNGGLLSKQTEQFDLIKKTLTKQIRDISSFEELFYSLSPSNIQLLISSQCALDLCKIFYELKQEPVKEPYAFRSHHIDGALFVLVKTNSSLYDSIFNNLPCDLLIAQTSKTINEEKYHCLIQIHPTDLSLIHLIQKKLRKTKATSRKMIFNIHFQEGSPPSCHPHLSADIKTLTFCKALFEGLTRISPKGNVELALAKDIDISPCKKRYTFTLRPSKWSNGEELTSYDFAKSWKRAISNYLRVKNFFPIKNAKKAHQGLISLDEVGIYTPSKHKLEIELEHPAPYFLQLLADPMYSPLFGTNISEEPTVFNGPFLPTTHKINEKIELTPNSFYWDSQTVQLKKIIISLIQDPHKAYRLYQNRKLNWIGSPFNVLPQKILQDSKSVQSYDSYSPFWLFCNTKNIKLSSTKIRQALSLAIDRKTLIKTVFPFYKPSYTIIPEKLSSLTENDPKDWLKKAPSIFEEGLKEIGFKREDFQLNLSHSNISQQKKLVLFLKKAWEKTFHIRVNLIEKSWNAHWNSIFNQEYEIGGFYIFTSYESPFYFMSSFEQSYNNFTRWENEDYQKYLDLAKYSVDPIKRAAYLKKAEILLNEHLPVIPVYNHTHLYMSDSSVKNFIFPKVGYADFKWVYFDD